MFNHEAGVKCDCPHLTPSISTEGWILPLSWWGGCGWVGNGCGREQTCIWSPLRAVCPHRASTIQRALIYHDRKGWMTFSQLMNLVSLSWFISKGGMIRYLRLSWGAELDLGRQREQHTPWTMCQTPQALKSICLCLAHFRYFVSYFYHVLINKLYKGS